MGTHKLDICREGERIPGDIVKIQNPQLKQACWSVYAGYGHTDGCGYSEPDGHGNLLRRADGVWIFPSMGDRVAASMRLIEVMTIVCPATYHEAPAGGDHEVSATGEALANARVFTTTGG